MMQNSQQTQLADNASLGAIFFRRARELGDRTFIKLQRGERLEEVSWRDFSANVRHTMLGLHSLGLKRGDKVAIIGENSLEWLCADMATLAGGFPNVGISPSVSDNLTLKMLSHSRCRAAFVQSEATVGKLLNLKGQLPALSHIITADGIGSGLPYTLNAGDLMARGARVDDQRFQEILESIHADDLATIIYTSGSTGEPKGVIRTHDNLLSNITNGGQVVVSNPEDLTVIVLTVNHLYGRFGFLKSAVTGRTVAILEASELAVNVKAIETLSPTAMSIVPRVMERMLNTILDQGENRATWEQLARLDETKSEKNALSAVEEERFTELRSRLKAAVKSALGGRIKYIAYAGAAMPPRIMRFFELSGIPLLGTYGSTECGGVTLSGIGENKPDSAGKPFANVELRIAGDGEILVRGPTVTPGYLENPEATREAIDAEGWFHTGDLGRVDADGCLFIVGRKKDVFYCSDGSNIYPGYIEILLENDPIIHQAILVGDHRPFIAALVVPDKGKIAAELGKGEAALTDADIKHLVHSRVEKINTGLEEAEKIRKIAVLENDFPPEVRGLTSIQKVKIDRKAVEEHYQREISEIYPSAAKANPA
jgi:long-chain acyl-CoA synthetase